MRLMVRWMYGVLVLAWAMCVLAGCNMDIRVTRRDASEDASDAGSARDAHRTTDAERAIPEGTEIVELPDSCEGQCPAVNPAYARVGFVQRGGETLMVGFLVDDNVVFVMDSGWLQRVNTGQLPFTFKLFRSSRVVPVVSIQRGGEEHFTFESRWAILTLAEPAVPVMQLPVLERTNHSAPTTPFFTDNALSVSHRMSNDGSTLLLLAQRCSTAVVEDKIQLGRNCLAPGVAIMAPRGPDDNPAMQLLGLVTAHLASNNPHVRIGPSFDYIQDTPRSVVDLAVTPDGVLMVVVDQRGRIIQRRHRTTGGYGPWALVTAQHRMSIQGRIEHVAFSAHTFGMDGSNNLADPPIVAQASTVYSPGCNTYWFDANHVDGVGSAARTSGGRWCVPEFRRPDFVPVDIVSCGTQSGSGLDVAILSGAGDILFTSLTPRYDSSQWNLLQRRTEDAERVDAIACAFTYPRVGGLVTAILAHMNPSGRLRFYLREGWTDEYSIWRTDATHYGPLISATGNRRAPSWMGFRVNRSPFIFSSQWEEVGALVPSGRLDDLFYGGSGGHYNMPEPWATVAMDRDWRVVRISQERWRAEELRLLSGVGVANTTDIPW